MAVKKVVAKKKVDKKKIVKEKHKLELSPTDAEVTVLKTMSLREARAAFPDIAELLTAENMEAVFPQRGYYNQYPSLESVTQQFEGQIQNAVATLRRLEEEAALALRLSVVLHPQTKWDRYNRHIKLRVVPSPEQQARLETKRAQKAAEREAKRRREAVAKAKTNKRRLEKIRKEQAELEADLALAD